MALMRQAMRGRNVTGDWADIKLVSLTGQTLEGRLAALKNLSLGTITIRDVPVVFGPIHTFEYWGLFNDRRS
jgi:hypothetical protein